MAIKTTTVSLEQFKSACGFTLSITCWGNRRKADMAKVQTDADKKRFKLSKELIKSPEYDAIKSYFGDLRQWVYSRTVPSFFKEGFQLASLAAVGEIEAKMKVAQGELAVLVGKLVTAYPASMDAAKVALSDQWSARDYPTVEQLPDMFAIGWNWLAFVIPGNLPEELRKTEQDKLERQMADAGEQITEALRIGFADLVSHAKEKLTVAPGEAPKIFRDSMIGNIQEFIDTFNQRNILNDVDLAALVAKAKEILTGCDPVKLRKYASTRDTTARAFGEIKAQLDTMIESKKTRAFDLSED